MKKGFTLVETIIFIGIISIVLVAFVRFVLSISTAREKNFVVAEVQDQARHAMDVLGQRIRLADSILTASSTFDVDPSVLALTMTSSTINPTVFQLTADNGILQITEGSGSAVSITGDNLRVTRFLVTDTTSSSPRGSAHVYLEVEYNNLSGDPRLDFSQEFQTTMGLRQ